MPATALPAVRPDVHPGPPTAPARPSHRRRILGIVVRVVPLLGLAVAITTWLHLPAMRVEPALIGLVCWTIGNYLAAPLRWRAVSARKRSWGWYTRVYAEGELLGMLTPAHSGAYLWRLRQLTRDGSDRTAAVIEITADRLSAGVMVLIFALFAGLAVPPSLLPDAGIAVAVVAAAAWLTRRWWQPRLLTAERPDRRMVARAAAISLAYQLGYLGFLLGLVAAVGHHVDPLATIGVIGFSQAAGMIPGIHGAGPREGAMAGGLVALGLPFTAAVSAVALGAALAWVPAVAVGGPALAVRTIRGRFAR